MSDPPILELRALSKTFPDAHEAVRGVTETFGAGEYVCILGASGCGKTTLLRLIAGFETPTAGEIRLEGRSMRDVAPERRNVNLVFQDYALFPHLSVRENVGFGLRVKGMPRAEAAARTLEALELVGLADRGSARPRELSGGQRQRVALARALVNHPGVLLLDEPLSALDRNLRLQMQDELRRIQREVGITFLHVTHDQGEALSLGDRVAVMHEGRFVQVGTPRDIYARPRSRIVAEFVGASNLIPAAVLAGWLGLPPGSGGLALVRPERIRLSTERPDAAAVPARVVRTTFLGPTLECAVEVDGERLTVHVPADRIEVPLPAGLAVWLHIAPDDIVPLDDG